MTEHDEHICDSILFILQLIISKETLSKNNNLSRKHVQELQSNLAKIVSTNETLNTDLQTASKTIVSLQFDFEISLVFFFLTFSD